MAVVVVAAAAIVVGVVGLAAVLLDAAPAIALLVPALPAVSGASGITAMAGFLLSYANVQGSKLFLDKVAWHFNPNWIPTNAMDR